MAKAVASQTVHANPSSAYVANDLDPLRVRRRSPCSRHPLQLKSRNQPRYVLGVGKVRKKWLQLTLEKLERGPDKNGGWRGGKRPGAGRPKIKNRRASEAHKTRPRIGRHKPLHVILRSIGELGSLRSTAGLDAAREALIAVYKHEDTFRIVHFSLQRKHIHLIVEADDYLALARGMKAFAGSMAKHFNALVSMQRGLAKRRRGSVFTDRYHAKVLSTPTQVRNTIAYVLNNWRHHREDRDTDAPVDRYSSGIYFDGWKQRENKRYWTTPSGYDIPLVAWARTYLLKVLWKKKHLISAYEVPGGGYE